MFKNGTINIPRFLLTFLILLLAFNFYIGIISPGGKLYSSFLNEYANVPAWFTYFICKSAKGILEVLGYDVYQKTLNNVTIVGSRGVNIIWACLGFRVLAYWVSFVTAHYAGGMYKFKWSMVGIVLITTINIIRIALIALALHRNWKAFIAIEPHFAFNVVCYIAILMLTFYFTIKYKRYKKEQLSNEVKEKQTSTIVT